MDEEEFEEETEELFSSREKHLLVRLREAVMETKKTFGELTDLIQTDATGLPEIWDKGRMWHNADSYSNNDAKRELVNPDLAMSLQKFGSFLDAVATGQLEKMKREEVVAGFEPQYYTTRASTPPRSRGRWDPPPGPNKATPRATKFRPFD